MLIFQQKMLIFHPSVAAIRNAFNPQIFTLSNVSVDDVYKEIIKLGNRPTPVKKRLQHRSFPAKIAKCFRTTFLYFCKSKIYCSKVIKTEVF